MKTYITPAMLPLVNMVLDQDPALRANLNDALSILGKLANDAAFAVRGGESGKPEGKPAAKASTAETGRAPGKDESAIVSFLASLRPGDFFPKGEIQKGSGLSAKAFAAAFKALRAGDKIEHNGKPGKGSAYAYKVST